MAYMVASGIVLFMRTPNKAHMIEKWRMVRGYDNYAISSFGRIRNLNTNRLLKHLHSKRGGYYPFINLSKNGKRERYNVHTLVAHAFLGPQLDGIDIHHKDTNRMNPRLENLEYLTKEIHREIHRESKE